MQIPTRQESYAGWLTRKMVERGFTQRSLAKAWNPADPETARRALRRYLKGMVPIARTRIEIARVLGSEESEPSSSDADEEADLVALLNRLARDARDVARRLVRAETGEAA